MIDIETSGLKLSRDVVIQYGFMLVLDNVPQDPVAINIKRPAGIISAKITEITGITDKDLQQGQEPERALTQLAELIRDMLQLGYIVGHNVVNFDLRMLHYEFKRYNIDLDIPDDKVIDTGILVKASQLNADRGPKETWVAWARRVGSIFAKGVYWSLDRYCIQAYELEELGANKSLAHNAGYDCYLSHLVLKRFKDGFKVKK